jgi:hypothetical protein
MEKDMRRISIVLLGIVLTGLSPAMAEENQKLSISDLRTPASPAFTLLGVSPTLVDRPGSARDFAISILSSLEESADGDLPRSVAVEATPYWWSGRDVTIEEYDRTALNPFTAVPRTFSLSLGTAATEWMSGTNTVEGTAIGIGARCLLFEGHMSTETNQLLKAAQEALSAEAAQQGAPGPIDLSEAAQAAVDKFRAANLQREGFMLEFAGAVVFDDREDGFEHTKSAVWLTPSFRTAVGSPLHNLTFVGVGRYTEDSSESSTQQLIDLGGRVVWAGAQFPAALSFEYVHRQGDDYDDSDHIVGVLEYRMSDTYSFIASFGRTFEDFEGQEQLVAIAGINIGFGDGPVVK